MAATSRGAQRLDAEQRQHRAQHGELTLREVDDAADIEDDGEADADQP
jgi:hypothetical protein